MSLKKTTQYGVEKLQDGKVVFSTDCKFYAVEILSAELILYKKDAISSSWTLANSTGETVMDGILSYKTFENGMLAVNNIRGWKVFLPDGTASWIPYTALFNVSPHLTLVSLEVIDSDHDDKLALAYPDGTFSHTFIDFAFAHEDVQAIAIKPGNWRFYSLSRKDYINSDVYSSIIYDRNNKVFITRKNKMYGVVDVNGETVLECSNDNITISHYDQNVFPYSNLILTTKGTTKKLYTLGGTPIIPTDFSLIHYPTPIYSPEKAKTETEKVMWVNLVHAVNSSNKLQALFFIDGKRVISEDFDEICFGEEFYMKNAFTIYKDGKKSTYKFTRDGEVEKLE